MPRPERRRNTKLGRRNRRNDPLDKAARLW
jgi:hypothetical protein